MIESSSGSASAGAMGAFLAAPSRARKATAAVLAQPFISIDEALDVARRSSEAGDSDRFAAAVFRLFTDAQGIRDATGSELARLIATVGSMLLAPVASLSDARSVIVDGWDVPLARAASAARAPQVRAALEAAVDACSKVQRFADRDRPDEESLSIACTMLGRPDLAAMFVRGAARPIADERDSYRTFAELLVALEQSSEVGDIPSVAGLAGALTECEPESTMHRSSMAALINASVMLFEAAEWTAVLAIAAFFAASGERNQIGKVAMQALQRAPVAARERWLETVDLCGADLGSLDLADHDLRGLRASAAIPAGRGLSFDPHGRSFFTERVIHHSFTFEDFCEDYGLFISDPMSRVLYDQVLDEDPDWETVETFPQSIVQVSLRGASLRNSDLRGAGLVFADAVSVDARDADLRDADLRYADLRGANLSGTDLRGANLCDADLAGANLQGARLDGAKCSGALVFSADLSGASLPPEFTDVVHFTLPAPKRLKRGNYGPDDDDAVAVPREFADLEDGNGGTEHGIDRDELAAAIGKGVLNAHEAESALDWTN